jgi:hypothetical protein
MKQKVKQSETFVSVCSVKYIMFVVVIRRNNARKRRKRSAGEVSALRQDLPRAREGIEG